jgi:hypothetical protein
MISKKQWPRLRSFLLQFILLWRIITNVLAKYPRSPFILLWIWLWISACSKVSANLVVTEVVLHSIVSVNKEARRSPCYGIKCR